MNNPEDVPINVDDEIAWLNQHRIDKSLSWSALAAVTGMPEGTLNPLLTGKYRGNHENQARRIYQFRQKVASQTERKRSAIAAPDYVRTPTARRFETLLEIAHMGRITVAATGPGTSKTMTARQYKAAMGDTVWLITMRQSSGTLPAMIDAAMRAMKMENKSGWTRQRSAQVMDHIANRDGLIIVDEANHCEWAALEELRGWHDATGVGIALLGNEELMVRIKGGANRHAYARLASRIAHYHIQDMPLEGDVRAYLDAMDIDEPATVKALIDVALSPGNGGLREVQQILEFANMLAIGEETIVEHRHIITAQKTRATQQLRGRA